MAMNGWPFCLADVVNGADVGMIERGGSLRLALKALEACAIVGHFIGQELQRDEAVAAGCPRLCKPHPCRRRRAFRRCGSAKWSGRSWLSPSSPSKKRMTMPCPVKVGMRRGAGSRCRNRESPDAPVAGGEEFRAVELLSEDVSLWCNAFHEKAGRSRGDSFWHSLVTLFLSAESPLSPPFHPHSSMSALLRSVQVGCYRFSRCCHLFIDLGSISRMKAGPGV